MKTILSMLVIAMSVSSAMAQRRATIVDPARRAVDPARTSEGKVEIPAEPRAKIRFIEENLLKEKLPTEVSENLARALENRTNNAELVDVKMGMKFIEDALARVLKVEVDPKTGKQKGRNYLIQIEKEALTTYQEWLSLHKEGEKVSAIHQVLGDSLISGYAKELTSILKEAIAEAKRTGRSISEVTREKLGDKVTEEELRLCKKAV